MPLWAWVGFTALILYYAFRLRRAYTTKEVRYGPFIYTAVSSPFTFRFMIVIECVVLVFLLMFFGYIIYHQAA